MRKRQSIPAFGSFGSEPIAEVNMTPLIDVMLVLIVMFIITIPITTHKVPLDLPSDGPVPERERIVHRLALDAAGAVTPDGRTVSQAELPALIAPIADDPASDLHLSAQAETPYMRFDEVLAIVKRAGIERLGLVGNSRFVAAL